MICNRYKHNTFATATVMLLCIINAAPAIAQSRRDGTPAEQLRERGRHIDDHPAHRSHAPYHTISNEITPSDNSGIGESETSSLSAAFATDRDEGANLALRRQILTLTGVVYLIAAAYAVYTGRRGLYQGKNPSTEGASIKPSNEQSGDPPPN